MVRILMIMLLFAAGPLWAAGVNPEDEKALQELRQEEQLREFERMQQFMRDQALVAWRAPVQRVMPIYYWHHIGTREARHVMVALCGGGLRSCKQAEERLRTYSRPCLTPMALVDLDLFDWTVEYQFSDGLRPVKKPETIYRAADSGFVLLERKIETVGGASGLGSFEPIALQNPTPALAAERVCGGGR